MWILKPWSRVRENSVPGTALWVPGNRYPGHKAKDFLEGKMKEHFDIGSFIVIVITFVLFIFALFTKGFTHDLLLEVGVFLVSVKLILMAYKNSVTSKELLSELNAIKKILELDHC